VGVPILADGREHVALAAGVQSDIETFLANCNGEWLDPLRKAAALYEGPLLEGWSGGPQEFEDWLTAERARIGGLAMELFLRLLNWMVPRPEGGERLFLARKALAIDPYNEIAHREELLASLELGLRGEAVMRSQDFARKLKAEMGLEIEPETRELVRCIKQGQMVPNAASPRPRLATFPLEHASADKSAEYLCTGIMSEIANVLSRFHSIQVIAPASSFQITHLNDRASEARAKLRKPGIESFIYQQCNSRLLI
jgi:DNA-binding SARP family transcriptional activator